MGIIDAPRVQNHTVSKYYYRYLPPFSLPLILFTFILGRNNKKNDKKTGREKKNEIKRDKQMTNTIDRSDQSCKENVNKEVWRKKMKQKMKDVGVIASFYYLSAKYQGGRKKNASCYASDGPRLFPTRWTSNDVQACEITQPS